jgi:hypothetical protein
MEPLLARTVGLLAAARDAATLAALCATGALFLREAFAVRSSTTRVRALLHAVCALAFLALGLSFATLVAHALRVTWTGVLLSVGAVVLVAAPVAWRRSGSAKGVVAALVDGLVQAVIVLLVLLGVSVTLMTVGFLALTADRPVLLVDVTGETGTRIVRWAAPDGPLTEEAVTTHRVVFREPGGEVVAEAWVYGDEVAVKGRVVRFSPLLSAAGVPNLFELLFAHNGYATAERHNERPHMAVPLPPLGPLAVPPPWKSLQERILSAWERRATGDETWGIRSATVESTYFPLVLEDGTPARGVSRVVLTPGGLTGG